MYLCNASIPSTWYDMTGYDQDDQSEAQLYLLNFHHFFYLCEISIIRDPSGQNVQPNERFSLKLLVVFLLSEDWLNSALAYTLGRFIEFVSRSL